MPPWIGCQRLHRQAHRPRHQREFLQRIAAIRHLGRQRVVLAFVAERLLVERLEDDIDLFLEQLAVGRLVEQRRTERLHLARVIAAAEAEDHPAARQNVRHRVVLGQAQRMPHRRDVEAAADLQVLRHVRQMQRHHQHVGNALGALALEMMLRHPERVVAVTVHQHRHRLRLLQRGGEMLVVIQPIVDRRAGVADVVQIDMARVEAVEFRDHAVVLRVLATMVVEGPWLATQERPMPELPDVEIFKHVLDQHARGRVVARAVFGSGQSGRCDSATLQRRLKGSRLSSSSRHGKVLFAEFEDAVTLAMHFGTNGSLQNVPSDAKEPPSTRLSFAVHRRQPARLSQSAPHRPCT